MGPICTKWLHQYNPVIPSQGGGDGDGRILHYKKHKELNSNAVLCGLASLFVTWLLLFPTSSFSASYMLDTLGPCAPLSVSRFVYIPWLVASGFSIQTKHVLEVCFHLQTALPWFQGILTPHFFLVWVGFLVFYFIFSHWCSVETREIQRGRFALVDLKNNKNSQSGCTKSKRVW